MLETVGKGLELYWNKWDTLVATRQDKQFFRSLKPTAVGWKVEDRAEYDRLVAELHDKAGQVVETWMNGRWIAKLLLRDAELPGDVRIIKVMMRRPGSSDAVGLDHVDFYSPSIEEVEKKLTVESDLKWTRENNDIIAGYDWLSVWFDGTEAKLKNDTVLDIVAAELKSARDDILRT
jgi:hypothetical protein